MGCKGANTAVKGWGKIKNTFTPIFHTKMGD